MFSTAAFSIPILILFFFYDSSADPQKFCSNNVCKNGGTCTLMSPTTIHAKCNSDEFYFQNKCYKIIREALNRTFAADHCNRRLKNGQSGGLLSILNEDQRRFVSEMLQNHVKSESKAYLSIGFWTGGRSIGKTRSNVQWFWQNTTSSMKVQFWEFNQPNFSDDLNNLCITLDVDSLFNSWKSQSCSDLNFFVCEKSTFDADHDNWLTQCQCSKGWKGQFCDIPSNPRIGTIDNEAIEQIACDDDELIFSCPNGGVILVDYARYGHLKHDNDMKCSKKITKIMEGDDYDCIDPTTLQTLIQKCQGLTFCQISKVVDLFQTNPCSKNYPTSLHYRMRCSTPSNILNQCPYDSIYIQGRCYSANLVNNPNSLMTYDESRMLCNLKGGDLANPQREPIFSMLYSEIDKQGKLYGKLIDEEKFWIRNDSNNLPSMENFKDLCPYLMVTTNVPKPSSCQMRFNWMCEYPPRSDLTDRITEFIGMTTTRGILTTTMRSQTLTEISTTTTTTTISSTETSTILTTNSTKPWNCCGSESTTTPSTTTTTTTGPSCPEITWKGVNFPETQACSEAIVPCPDSDEITGNVHFQCHCTQGIWIGQPDWSSCTHKWVIQLPKKITNNENSIDIVDDMTKHLQTNVAEQKLFGGDIKGIIDAGENLIPLAHRQIQENNDEKEFAWNFTSKFGESGNQLLADKAIIAWDQLDKKIRIEKANNLMILLELSLAFLGEHMSTSELSYSNWQSKVESKMPVSMPSSMVEESSVAASGNIAAGSAMNVASVNEQADMVPSRARMPPRPKTQFSMPKKQEASKNVEFTGIDAPMMQLPGFDILAASATNTDTSEARMPAATAQESMAGSRLMVSNVADVPLLKTSFAAAAAPRPAPAPAPIASSSTKLAYFMYNSIGNLLLSNSSSIINSRVIGAFVNDPTKSLQLPTTAPVNFTFYHLRKSGVTNPRCVYWDTKEMFWSENGCQMIETSEDSTKCSCNHLTSFAILMDVNANLDMLTGRNAIALDLITIIGCALSIICLLLSFMIFTLFRSLYNVRHAIHANLCLCLLIAELLFVLGIDKPQHLTSCRGVAISLHYFFLAAFCWMLLEGYQLYMMLIQVFEPNRSRIYMYYIIGYGLPAIIVAISASLTWENYGTLTYCWINVRTSTIWAFVIPIIVVILTNIIILFIALRVVLSVKSRDRTTTQKILGWLKGSAMLLCLLGITWIFGFLTAIPQTSIIFAYIFAILNCLQGVFIFILHVMFNDKVRIVLIRTMRQGICFDENSTSKIIGTTNYSTNKTNTGYKFFSKQRLMKFFKNEPYISSQHSTESTETKNNNDTSPKFHHKMNIPMETKITEWHSKVIESSIDIDETMTDRPSITLTPPTTIVTLPMKDRGNSMPNNHHDKKELLRIENNSLHNRHSAPVKRKKFPLGSTEEQRQAELKGNLQINSKTANIIVEKL